MKTIWLLFAEHETGEIPLRDICEEHLGMDYKTACYNASKQRLPFPVHKNGSQKSLWMVDINDLAKHIDEQKEMAKNEWRKMNAA